MSSGRLPLNGLAPCHAALWISREQSAIMERVEEATIVDHPASSAVPVTLSLAAGRPQPAAAGIAFSPATYVSGLPPPLQPAPLVPSSRS